MITFTDSFLTRWYGTMVQEENLTIPNYNGEKAFKLYDGIAYCNGDENGKEFVITYPKMEIIKKASELSNAIMKFCNLNNIDEIKTIHILKTFGRIIEI